MHVDSIDHYPGVVPSGWRGLGIFPLARVARARLLTCPHVSQWNIGLIRRFNAKPWRESLARSGFDKDHWPNMADLNWANGVFRFYNTKPYWD